MWRTCSDLILILVFVRFKRIIVSHLHMMLDSEFLLDNRMTMVLYHIGFWWRASKSGDQLRQRSADFGWLRFSLFFFFLCLVVWCGYILKAFYIFIPSARPCRRAPGLCWHSPAGLCRSWCPACGSTHPTWPFPWSPGIRVSLCALNRWI